MEAGLGLESAAEAVGLEGAPWHICACACPALLLTSRRLARIGGTVIIAPAPPGPVISRDAIAVLPGGRVLNVIEGIVGARNGLRSAARQGGGPRLGLRLDRDTRVLTRASPRRHLRDQIAQRRADNPNKMRAARSDLRPGGHRVLNPAHQRRRFGISSGGLLKSSTGARSTRPFGITPTDAFVRTSATSRGVFGVDLAATAVLEPRRTGRTFGLAVFGKPTSEQRPVEAGCSVNVFRDARSSTTADQRRYLRITHGLGRIVTSQSRAECSAQLQPDARL